MRAWRRHRAAHLSTEIDFCNRSSVTFSPSSCIQSPPPQQQSLTAAHNWSHKVIDRTARKYSPFLETGPGKHTKKHVVFESMCWVVEMTIHEGRWIPSAIKRQEEGEPEVGVDGDRHIEASHWVRLAAVQSVSLPLISKEKKGGNVIRLYFAKRNSLNCTSTEMLLLYVEKRKRTYILLFVQGRGMDDRQPSQWYQCLLYIQ